MPYDCTVCTPDWYACGLSCTTQLGVDPVIHEPQCKLLRNLCCRNFQKYAISQDVHGVGVISTPELEAAMKVFLRDHWKFDGVLW